MIADPAHVSRPEAGAAAFITALLFFVTGSVLLAAGAAPLAALHAFAAFIVLAIVAASNQLIPVLTSAPPAPPASFLAIVAGLAAGFALLVASFLGVPAFAFAGAILLAAALAWSIWTLLRLLRGTREREIALALGAGAIAFGVAAAIGASMAGALAGIGSIAALRAAPAHAALAIVAFAGFIVMAISYRLVPMFALAHVRERRLQRLPQWIVFGAGIAVAAFAGHALPVRAVLALGALAFGAAHYSHLTTLRARLRKHLDVSLRYACVAWAFGDVALLIAIAAPWTPAYTGAAIACAVLGWLNLSVLGYAYKILGFLSWQFAKERRPDAQLPALASAVSERGAMTALVLLAAGTIGSAATLGIPPAARFAGGLYAFGALCALVTFANLFRRYLSPLRTSYAT